MRNFAPLAFAAIPFLLTSCGTDEVTTGGRAVAAEVASKPTAPAPSADPETQAAIDRYDRIAEQAHEKVEDFLNRLEEMPCGINSEPRRHCDMEYLLIEITTSSMDKVFLQAQSPSSPTYIGEMPAEREDVYERASELSAEIQRQAERYGDDGACIMEDSYECQIVELEIEQLVIDLESTLAEWSELA